MEVLKGEGDPMGGVGDGSAELEEEDWRVGGLVMGRLVGWRVWKGRAGF